MDGTCSFVFLGPAPNEVLSAAWAANTMLGIVRDLAALKTHHKQLMEPEKASARIPHRRTRVSSETHVCCRRAGAGTAAQIIQGLTSTVVTEAAIREPLHALSLTEHEACALAQSEASESCRVRLSPPLEKAGHGGSLQITTMLYAHHSIHAISQLSARQLADTTAVSADSANSLEHFFSS